MPGVAGRSGGSTKKSAEQHKQSGLYRPGLHDAPKELAFAQGKPEPPADLGPSGQYLWQLITDNSPQHLLTKIDSASLYGVCRWYQVWRDCDELCRQYPGEAKYVNTAHKAYTALEKSMVHFGLTPAARARLAAAAPDRDENPLSALAAERA